MKGFGIFLIIFGGFGIYTSYSQRETQGAWNDGVKGGLIMLVIGGTLYGIGASKEQKQKEERENQKREEEEKKRKREQQQQEERERQEREQAAAQARRAEETRVETLRLENEQREQELELERRRSQKHEQDQEARRLEEKRIEAADKEKRLITEKRALEEKRIEAIDKEKWLAAEQRALEEAKLEALRLENSKLELEEAKRQNQLLSYPLIFHIDTFLKNYDELSKMALNGEQENKVFSIYLKLQGHLQKNSKIPLDQREQVARDVMLIHQNRTIVDLYSEEIRKVKKDPDLDDDEEEREAKVNHWKDLRQKHIEAIQSKVEPR